MYAVSLPLQTSLNFVTANTWEQQGIDITLHLGPDLTIMVTYFQMKWNQGNRLLCVFYRTARLPNPECLFRIHLYIYYEL